MYYFSHRALRLSLHRAATPIRLSPFPIPAALFHRARSYTTTGDSDQSHGTDGKLSRTKQHVEEAHEQDSDEASVHHHHTDAPAQSLSLSTRVRQGWIRRYRRACRLSFMRDGQSSHTSIAETVVSSPLDTTSAAAAEAAAGAAVHRAQDSRATASHSVDASGASLCRSTSGCSGASAASVLESRLHHVPSEESMSVSRAERQPKGGGTEIRHDTRASSSADVSSSNTSNSSSSSSNNSSAQDCTSSCASIGDASCPNASQSSSSATSTTAGSEDGTASYSSDRLWMSSNAFTHAAFLGMPFYEPIKRIILVRNGASVANENIDAYIKQPDWLIPLVEHGKRQCIRAGRELRELIGDEPVYFYYSPYLRSRQSLRWVLGGYDSSTLLPLPPSADELASDKDGVSSAAKANKAAGSGGVASSAAAESGDHWIDSSTAVMNAINQAALALSQRRAAAMSSVAAASASAASSSVTKSNELSSATASSSASAAATGNHGGCGNSMSIFDDAPSKAEDGPVGNDLCLTDDVFSSFGLPIDTLLQLHPHTCNSLVSIREDVRLRDGDIGRYKSIDELRYHLTERERYGRFFYRFPHGESGADVCDRVTSFLDALQRERTCFPMNTNVVIITHGLTIRMFIKRWFHLTVDTFDQMRSPPSGSISTLTRMHHQSHFRLEDQCFEAMRLPVSLNETNGYKYRNKQLFGSMSTGAPYM